MGAAWAALHEGYRGNKYEGPNKEEAITKLRNLYKREGLETPSKADYEIAELRARIEYLVSKLDTQPKKEPHILDGVLEKLKADYDEVVKSDMPAQEKLKALQPSFESIATAISESINKNEPVVANPEADVAKAVAEAVKSAIQPLAEQMGQLLAQMSNYQPSVQKPIVPERRSIQPTRDMQEYISQVMRKKSETPNLRAIIERTT
jgi:anion-transporting  ArsA/GET3 family ATPase